MDEGKKGEAGAGPSIPAARRLSCTKCFDILWFCYSPFHQMQQYYRYGEFDNCFAKWHDLYDCLALKTKKSSEIEGGKGKFIGIELLFQPNKKEIEYNCGNWNSGIAFEFLRSSPCFLQEILVARENEKKHIWTYRTVDEASENWLKMYSRFLSSNPPETNP